ncbi:MAG TPA: FlgD immunoglobulin-like domain containing protein [Bacteroidota bacterium]|nr:FlgD immunoglobulin-like domain containing protein [Bacteroidota bacterium]
MRKLLCVATVLVLGISVRADSATFRVPLDYAKIQLAIDASSNGDTIIVDRGRYFENINFKGKKIVLASEFIFSGDNEDVDSTIIDGSLPLNPDTASTVLFITGEDASSVLEGFTITGGSGTITHDEQSSQLFRRGGGVFCSLTSPTIAHNVITGNSATNDSGLISAGGGGIRCGGGSPRILNNVIMYNKAKYGGGIVLQVSAALVRNNVLFRNSGGEDFGCGGIWITGSSAGPTVLENNTIYENSSVKSPGGVYLNTSMFVGRNNIIWGNSAPSAPQILADSPSPIAYSDVQGGWTGTGNINLNPQFLDTSCYLGPGSPCIDAGNPGTSFRDPEDTLNPGAALWPSLGGVRNDMGAYGGPGRSASVYVDLHLNDPRPPSSVIAYSDYQTSTSIAVTWHDPTQHRNGTPLSGFAIHLYRDYTFLSSVDSGVEMFVDSNLVQHQHYTYQLLTAIAADSSVFDSAGAYAGGHAQSMPPASFSAADNVAGVTLRWTNPSRQVDNTPLNDLAAILIYRDGAPVDSLAQTAADTGQQRSYVDAGQGYHFYRLRTKDNETPTHYSGFTDSLLGFGGLDTVYVDGFENGRGKGLATGTWDTVGAKVYSGKYSLTDSPVGDYVQNSATSFMLPPVILGNDMVLEYHDIAIVRPLSHAIVQFSNNQRRTFRALKDYNWSSYAQWSDESADSGDWVTERFNLSAYAGDTVTIRFLLTTSGFAPADGWYIDSVSIRQATGTAVTEFVNQPEWNLLSLPLSVDNGKRGNVYPNSHAPAFSYNGRYVAEDSLRVGKGYWIKFDSSSTTHITGKLIPIDTVIVSSGWNLIGAISFDMDSSKVKTDPAGILRSQYYEYNGQYEPVNTLRQGKGYWVKVSQSGKLIFSSFTPSPTIVAVVEADRGNHELPNTLRFTDNGGRHTELLFVGSGSGNRSWERLEAPPLPPGGGFDIRFSSDRFIAEGDRAHDKEFPILMQSVRFPLTVEWRITEETEGACWQLSHGSSTISLRSDGKIRLEKRDQLVLQMVGGVGIRRPGSFGLEQNYPNPFNPSTRIDYQLAEESNVTVTIYDVIGRNVKLLVDEVQQLGLKSVQWNGTNNEGNPVATGFYLCRLVAHSNFDPAKKYSYEIRMLLLR